MLLLLLGYLNIDHSLRIIIFTDGKEYYLNIGY